MLQVTDLSKTFGSGDTEVKAVDGVTFTVPTGVFAAVVGRSGSGKSTLLSLLGALDKPTSGTIEVDGAVISKGSDHELIRYRRNQIGFVFQSYNLIPNLNALQNVMLPMEFAGVSRSERRERAANPALADQAHDQQRGGRDRDQPLEHRPMVPVDAGLGRGLHERPLLVGARGSHEQPRRVRALWARAPGVRDVGAPGFGHDPPRAVVHDPDRIVGAVAQRIGPVRCRGGLVHGLSSPRRTAHW